MRQNSSGKLLVGNRNLPVNPKNERGEQTPGPPQRKRQKQSVALVGTPRKIRQGKHTPENRPCQSRKSNVARTGFHPLFASHRLGHFAVR